MDNIKKMYEFDFDIAISKLGFKEKSTFTISEAKVFLLYTLGKKLKKYDIIKQIQNIRGENEDVIFIKKEELKLLQELNQNTVTSIDYLQSLFSYITNNDPFANEITLELFRNRIKEILPNLSKGLINQAFYYLSDNRDKISKEELMKKANKLSNFK